MINCARRDASAHRQWPTTPMRFAALVCLLLVVATGSTFAANAIDRFEADGVSTYCKIAGQDATPPFYVLSPISKGKCPVAITMKVTKQSVTALTATFYVEWNITVNHKRSDHLFPVDLVENLMTIDDTVTACAVETNCTSDNDVILPRGVSDTTYEPYVNINSTETVVLLSYRMRIPPKGTYLIVGDVTVNTEGVKPIHNYVFLKVSASDDVVDLPGTVRPALVESSENKSEVSVPMTPVPILVVSMPPTQSPQTSETNAQNASTGEGVSSPSHGSAINAIVLAGMAAAALVAAAMYFVIARRSSSDDQPLDASDSEPGNRPRNCRRGSR